jgi:hypothetical protein
MDIAAIKQRQQAAWPSGDYAAVGTRLLLTAELLRVCRPGGRIGMVNWTPGSSVGELFRAIGRRTPHRRACGPRSSGAARSALRPR